MSLLWLLLQAFLVLQTQSANPPSWWQEHWFEHNQNVTLRFTNNDLAVYFDNNMDTSITWPNTYLNDVWLYVKRRYGQFGSDPRLFVVFHAGRYGGGHPSTYFDASHDYRNVIDCGSDQMGAWTSGTGNDLDLTTHEVGHIVEGASKGFHNSPAFTLWGDSKWNEIFIYDVYIGLGRTADAQRWFNLTTSTVDSYPRANTSWFRDWFYPIYSMDSDGGCILNKFFVLLAAYFPKSGQDYARDMNMGEFVHFWSGAANVDLKAQATTAFGWTSDYDTQFNQAKQDFPNVTYLPLCVNVQSDDNCNYWMGQGYCSASSQYYAYMTGNCKKACSLCPAKPACGVVLSTLTVFDGANYSGTSKTYPVSNTCNNDLASTFNDMTSSLQLTPGSCVELFGAISCAGGSKQYTANTASLVADGMDNSASSFRACSSLTVFADASFGGASKTYTLSGACNNDLAYNFNDITSSLKLTSGCVELFGAIDCTGGSKQYTADTASLVADGLDNTASSFRACSSVTFYDGANYGGASRTYTVSGTCNNDLTSTFNDLTSSLQVTGCVEIYTDNNCGGASKQYNANTASLTADGLDNQASSFRACSSVTFYDGANYGGSSKTYPVSNTCNSDLASIFNDMTSSLQVTGCVQIFSDSGCSGTTKQYLANTASLTADGFDNSASSFRACS